MISALLIIEILLIHFLADFALQTHAQAQGKGEGSGLFNLDLLKHVSTYSLVWFIWLGAHYGLDKALFGVLFVFVTHYITDWITSRLSKPLFASGDFHNGFVIVGADQVAHYISLIVLILILNK